ncbi:hypothetical protein AMJ48_00245 [Parcubacteria bacterium DG_74_1]|nr:MAG: hypothetical protein AMJ48_00245 [Parcubacteria bacterium DG_74_1]
MEKRSPINWIKRYGEIRLSLRGRTPPALIPPGLFLPLLVITNPIKATSFGELVGGLLNFLWWITVALVPLMIVIAGFYFITAAGDPVKTEKAKGIILYTVIGFFIVLLARGLIELLQRIL